MITPYTEVPIPRVETPFDHRLRGYLEEIRGFAIPGVIIEDSGADMLTARRALTPLLESMGANVDDLPPIPIRIGDPAAHEDDRQDRGLHLDALPGGQRQRFVNLNLHRVACGEVEVRLALVAPTFMDVLRADAGKENHGAYGTPMPGGTKALFAEGKVDPLVLSPTVYVGNLAARAMVIFNLTGRRPAAHEFISRTAWRVSEISTARMVLPH
jgi:hypothetical protein